MKLTPPFLGEYSYISLYAIALIFAPNDTPGISSIISSFTEAQTK